MVNISKIANVAKVVANDCKPIGKNLKRDGIVPVTEELSKTIKDFGKEYGRNITLSERHKTTKVLIKTFEPKEEKKSLIQKAASKIKKLFKGKKEPENVNPLDLEANIKAAMRENKHPRANIKLDDLI